MAGVCSLAVFTQQRRLSGQIRPQLSKLLMPTVQRYTAAGFGLVPALTHKALLRMMTYIIIVCGVWSFQRISDAFVWNVFFFFILPWEVVWIWCCLKFEFVFFDFDIISWYIWRDVSSEYSDTICSGINLRIFHEGVIFLIFF